MAKKKVAKITGAGGAAMKMFGVPEMRKLLGQYAKDLGPESNGKLRAEIKDVLMIPAQALRDEARDLAPVRTGVLRDSIVAVRGPDDAPGVVVLINTHKAWYAWFVEFGSSRASPHPFFRPAITATRGIMAAMIADGIKALIYKIAADHAYTPPAGLGRP